MQGLLQQPQQAPQQPQQDTGEGTQEQYDVAAGQLIQWVASDEGYQVAEQALQSGDVQKSIAMLIGRLLTMMNQSAYLSGKKIPPKVLFQAGMEVARALSAIGQKIGVLDKQNEAQITEDAFFDGIVLFANESAEEALTPDDRARYTQLIDQVEQMASKAQPQTQPNQQVAQ